MTIVLNGTTGITNDGGYTGDGVSFADTTPANTLATTTGGNVGIGTTSPSGKLHIKAGNADQAYFDNAGEQYTQVTWQNNGTAKGAIWTDNTNSAFSFYAYPSLYMNFWTGGSERMRIDSSGNLLVGTTSIVGSGRLVVKSGGNPIVSWNPETSGNNGLVAFGTEASYTERGYIYYNRGAGQVQLSATSDERLKENIVDAPSVLPIIESIKVRQFDWKETGNTNIGFIAQELYEIVPDSVCVGEDNEDGTVKRNWGISKEHLVPYLVKAIQEQQAIISDLKARIETLEQA